MTVGQDLLDVWWTQSKDVSATPDHAQRQLAELRKQYDAVSGELPSYERRKMETRLDELHRELEARLQPRRKLAFANTSSISTNESALPRVTLRPVATAHRECLYLASDDIDETQGSIALARLHRCIVNIIDRERVSAIQLHDISETVLMLGKVHGSVLIEKCERCFVAVSCQQLRIHSTQTSHFCVSVVSPPITEECNGLTFEELPQAFRAPATEIGSLTLANFDDPLRRSKPRSHSHVTQPTLWPVRPVEGEALQQALRALLPQKAPASTG